ncbi:hypothetical protein M8C21_001819, partial [Ambrosia artemisiifolia]
VVHHSELLFSEILTAISQMAEKRDMKVPQSRGQIADLEAMLRNEKTEFEESMGRILNQEVKKGQRMIDILEINRLRRQLLFQSYVWDHRLVYASSVDSPQHDPNDMGSEHGDKPIEMVPDMKSAVDSCKVSDVGENETSTVSSPVEEHEWSDPLISDVCVRRAISEGQFPVLTSLSDTLEAAWTGNHPNSSGLSDLDLNVPDKLEKGDRMEESKTSSVLSPVLSTKGSETMEDSTGWLGVPFLNFYRSLNKNFSTTSEKLDTFNGYNPVYISSFRESELQGGARLLLAVGINDTVIPVYDDEPTSIISYTLLSPDYISQVSDEFDAAESSTIQSSSNFDGMSLDSFKSFADDGILSLSGSRTSLMSDPASQTKLLHSRVEFTDNSPFGKVKYTVTVYYAKRFEALRKICCPSEMDYIRSLSRCKKWGAQGGKSNVFFAKTLDDRFIIKQ